MMLPHTGQGPSISCYFDYHLHYSVHAWLHSRRRASTLGTYCVRRSAEQMIETEAADSSRHNVCLSFLWKAESGKWKVEMMESGKLIPSPSVFVEHNGHSRATYPISRAVSRCNLLTAFVVRLGQASQKHPRTFQGKRVVSTHTLEYVCTSLAIRAAVSTV